jgi:hypothetical protein
MGAIVKRAVSRRRSAWLAVALVVALSAGCASIDWATVGGSKPPAVCQLGAMWQNTVLFAPDPTHNGNPSPLLAGRVYLFGADLKDTLIGDGSLAAELYDCSGREPEQVERWEIDPATLKRLVKQDGLIGWGYTVYLPWTKRSPDLTKMSKVKLRVRYQPGKGAPLFTENDVTLSPTNGNVSVEQGPPMTLPQVPPVRR